MKTKKIDIEDLLIWAYKTCAVDEVPRGLGGPALAKMRWNEVACPDDQVGSVHADALAVDAAVRGLGSKALRGVIIACAKNANRPETFDGAHPVMAWVPWGKDPRKPKPIRDRNFNVTGHEVRSSVQLAGGAVLDGWSMDDVQMARELYTSWREALADLVDVLGGVGVLEGYQVTGPNAEAYPWCVAKAA